MRRSLLVAALILGNWSAAAQTVVENLQKQAAEGDVDAQVRLAMDYMNDDVVYSDGSGIKKDYAEAERWLQASSNKGSSLAQYLLGTLYLRGSVVDDPNYVGTSVQQDDAKAAFWYRRFLISAEKESDRPTELLQAVSAAQFSLGLMYYQECDPHENITGLINLSPCERAKLGGTIVRDYGEALQLLSQSAEAGKREAQYYLATMYEFGRGAPQDFSRAAKLYESAAIKGYHEAIPVLGALSEKSGDLVSAHMWFNIAASTDNPRVAETLGARRDKVGKRLSPSQLQEAQSKAADWTTRHPLILNY